VHAIRRTDKGVAVQYIQAGVKKQAEAEYCVIALPFEMLKKIPNDLSPEVKTVIEGSVPFGFCIDEVRVDRILARIGAGARSKRHHCQRRAAWLD